MAIISFSATNQQKIALEGEAKAKGMSLPHYIKSIVVKDPAYDAAYAQLCSLVQAAPAGEFSIKTLFGKAAWGALETRIRLSMGRAFYDAVRAGVVPGVQALNKRSNVQWYQKEEA